MAISISVLCRQQIELGFEIQYNASEDFRAEKNLPPPVNQVQLLKVFSGKI